MLSLQDAFHTLRQVLYTVYDENEAAAIAHELLEHITGKNKLLRLSDKNLVFTAEQQKKFDNAKQRLLQGEPLQYITEVQWFLGNPFYVNKHVLIPRPETEELVQWIIDDGVDKENQKIFDIGTGSGCIPVSLKRKLPDAVITSCDISGEALHVARQNAERLHSPVNFIQMDFLEQTNWLQLDRFDVIVSNPPYIPFSERETLDKNVRDFEPSQALFVPEDDALLFYRNIALFGKTHLSPHGAIYCEVHRDFAVNAKMLFEEMSYKQVILRKDMHGNFRMLKAEH